ncbi:hypothetical protein BHS09_21145 [Myxococcus xanthus]|uniref:Uncharacterized protein n=1 Tax=Myxococcus xanthus TaxID=34 RepID=A0AAE6KTH0_MYXXA|nr:DUF6624 domain-containing protein [Myxococcus xanthus]QDE69279.1 hypothetical protein BHS09_21145 [Myxococcus xanthus]QDE76556.1 hypothetical protein BHS08_21160 [Myxococcus xanthus]
MTSTRTGASKQRQGRPSRQAPRAARTQGVAPRPTVNRDLRGQLLRLDRIDNTLRSEWVATEFKDRDLERKLQALTDAGIDWLRETIKVHGWPGHRLVGRSGAAAAWRLIQHAECSLAFQKRCLTLLRDAAARGDVPIQQVAYLTDVVRMRERKKQLYGTKFRKVKGELVPYPIEKEAWVDLRRKEMNLPSLAAYARKLRRAFQPS